MRVVTVDSQSVSEDDEEPCHTFILDKTHIIELAKSKIPSKERSIKQDINMKIESAMLLDWVSTCLVKNHKIMKQISKEAYTFNDFPITFQDANYRKDNKTLKNEKVKVHSKKIIDKVETNVDVFGITMRKLMRFHQAIGNRLAVSMEK